MVYTDILQYLINDIVSREWQLMPALVISGLDINGDSLTVLYGKNPETPTDPRLLFMEKRRTLIGFLS